jgi:hypothetical protein
LQESGDQSLFHDEHGDLRTEDGLKPSRGPLGVLFGRIDSADNIEAQKTERLDDRRIREKEEKFIPSVWKSYK